MPRQLLDKAGMPTRVVSVPSMELFEKQGKAYKEKLLGTEKIRIAIEAAVRKAGTASSARTASSSA